MYGPSCHLAKQLPVVVLCLAYMLRKPLSLAHIHQKSHWQKSASRQSMKSSSSAVEMYFKITEFVPILTFEVLKHLGAPGGEVLTGKIGC